VKKGIRWLVVVVAVVWVLQDPSGAAHLAHQIAAWLTHAAHSLSTLGSGL
jgi:hypothetical protein